MESLAQLGQCQPLAADSTCDKHVSSDIFFSLRYSTVVCMCLDSHLSDLNPGLFSVKPNPPVTRADENGGIKNPHQLFAYLASKTAAPSTYSTVRIKRGRGVEQRFAWAVFYCSVHLCNNSSLGHSW